MGVPLGKVLLVFKKGTSQAKAMLKDEKSSMWPYPLSSYASLKTPGS